MWTRILVLFVLMMGSVVSAQTITPTPPSPVDADTSDLYQFMATAAYNVNQLPSQIDKQGNTSLIPSSNAVQLFSYAKWLFSFNTANELLGKTFAPIGINLFVVLTIGVFMALIWFTIRVVALIIRFVIWIINQVLKLIPFW